MSWKVTAALQIGALAIQVLIPSVPGISPAWVAFSRDVVAFLQGAQAILAHWFNPNGTSADVPASTPKG